MEQSPVLIEKAYNLIADEYTEHFKNELKNKPLDRDILLRFSKEMSGRSPVWDFGCGPGQTTQFLYNLGVEVSGLDLSEKLIEQANFIHPGIFFNKGNMLALDFSDNSIAGIVAFYAIVHFSKTQVIKAFHEVFRVLQPGGIFLFSYHIGEELIHVDEFLGKEVSLDFMFFSTDFITDCVKQSGFDNIDIIEREPYPDVEYQSRRAYIFAEKPKVFK